MNTGPGDARCAVVAVARATLLDAVRTHLEAEHLDVRIAAGGDASQALRAASGSALVVLDMRFGGLDNLETVRRLRAQGTDAPVMLLSESGDPGDRAAGLDAGADEWTTTPFDVAEFRARVRALLRRRGLRLASVLVHCGLTFDTVRRAVHVRDKPVDLSPRETNLLHMLLLNFNGVVTRERIFDEFYGLGESAGPNTIEVYVSRLRRKLRDSGLHIRTLHGRGYAIGVHDDGP